MAAWGDTIPGFAPSIQVEVQWDEWLHVHMARPCIVQLALSVLFYTGLAPGYKRIFRRCICFQDFMRLYIGTPDQPEVPRARGYVAICSLQMFSSLVTVVIWITNSYMQGTTFVTRSCMSVSVGIDLLNWAITCLKSEFSLWALWDIGGLIDVVTIVPTVVSRFLEPPPGTDWLTFHFFRSYSILFNYQKILTTGHLKHTGVMAQMIILAALRIYCLIVPMTGLILTSEILGDPPLLADSFIETPAGDRLSFMQMVNWIIVSIATLGDGSFYPRTVISRTVWSVFLVIAVGYVFWIQFSFGQAWVQNREGSGAYNPRKRHPHVVVFLQVHGHAEKLASVVVGFLSEVLHSAYVEEWPDVVFFCSSYWEQTTTNNEMGAHTLQKYLKEKHFGIKARQHVSFIVGDTSRKEDLERACLGGSALAFIIPDINTNSPERDDELNIFTALTLKKFYANVRLRLMLLLPQSKDLAVQAGIMMERCFAVRELKAHMLAQNVRCHGLLPMITAIFKTVDASEEKATMKRSSSKGGTASPDMPVRRKTASSLATTSSQVHTPQWIQEYVHGMQRSIFGFELSPQFEHKTFGELVAIVHEGCGAVVIAVLLDGIQVCPQDTQWQALHQGQVCFAIAEHASDLDPYRDPKTQPDNWRKSLTAQRDAIAKRTATEGPHVAAARLLGKQLQEVILKTEDHVAELDACEWEREESGGSSGRSAGAEGGLQRRARRRNTKKGTVMSVGGMSYVTGLGERSVITASEAAEDEELALVERVRLLRQSVHETEELVVVVVCQGEVWQQVRAFVSALRAQYQPVFRPVIILAPTEPPPRLLHGIKDRVLTMTGSCLKVHQLVEAGVLEAGSVVVMAGEVPQAELEQAPLLKDSRVVLCSRMLECWCGVSKKEVFTTYELLDSQSVSDLPHLMTKPSVHLESFLAEKAFMEEAIEEEFLEEDEADLSERPGNAKVDPRKLHAARSSDNLMSKSQRVESITFNMRFAAGQVMTPEVWGCMLGRMYYNPAVIELTEALVMPQRRGQRAFPWQMRPPSGYIGACFKDLVVDLALGYWMDPNAPPKVRPEVQQHTQPREGPAVALAMYRKRSEFFLNAEAAEGTGGNHYLVLAPPRETTILEDDYVLVLGSRRFGRKLHQLGLLRGSRQATEEEDPDSVGKQVSRGKSAKVSATSSSSPRTFGKVLEEGRRSSSPRTAEKVLEEGHRSSSPRTAEKVLEEDIVRQLSVGGKAAASRWSGNTAGRGTPPMKTMELFDELGRPCWTPRDEEEDTTQETTATANEEALAGDTERPINPGNEERRYRSW